MRHGNESSTGFGSSAFTAGLLAAVVAVAACGGSAPPGTKSAAEVQSSKLGDTFAGQNRCNPKNHDRPFIIEWDATDMSSFESRAASDVVFVRYQGGRTASQRAWSGR